MSERIAITEESGIHKEWMERAKKIKSTKELTEFVDELRDKYEHDYGTICHAIAAAAVGAAWAVERGPSGGITGFQAGCIMWEIIGGWGVFSDGPKQIIEWNNLLYPQYDEGMPRTISKSSFDRVVEEAKKRYAADRENPISEKVKERMFILSQGKLPPGISLRGE